MLKYRINHCLVGVLHRNVQRRYVVSVKVERTYVRYINYILLIRDQVVAYRIISFIHQVPASTVISLCDQVGTTPPRSILMRIFRANFGGCVTS